MVLYRFFFHNRIASVRGPDRVYLDPEGRDGQQAAAHVGAVRAQAVIQLRMVILHARVLFPGMRGGGGQRDISLPPASPVQLRLQVI